MSNMYSCTDYTNICIVKKQTAINKKKNARNSIVSSKVHTNFTQTNSFHSYELVPPDTSNERAAREKVGR